MLVEHFFKADIDEYSLEAVRLNAQMNLNKDQTDRLELSNLDCFSLTTVERG